MSGEMWTRIILSLILAGNLVWYIYSCRNRERVVRSDTDDRRRYLRYGFGNVLPWIIGAYLALGIGLVGIEQTIQQMFPMMCSTFLHICVYYFMLLLCLPVLRRMISARVCATLWILPNVLYLTYYVGMNLSRPQWIIPLPGFIWKYAFALWGMGFILVMLFKIISHGRFRRQILRDAQDVSDPDMLNIWEKAKKEAGYTKENGYKKLPYRMVISSAVRTPLSIGFFRRTICVVLPEKEYTSEDLLLILRHELVHIGREDSSNKFFLAFCTAMCWFNPLMWIAGRCCADDLELSCDETVLLAEDQDVRQRYARLLLQTVGDDRGFTTCLSTSARALRYRLKHIIKPGKRRTGAFLAGIIAFVLLISCGHVAFAGPESMGEQVIFQSRDLSEYTIEKVQYYTDGESEIYEQVSETALIEYLERLHLHEFFGKYSFSNREEYLYIRLGEDEKTMEIIWLDDILLMSSGAGNSYITRQFYCPEKIDWEYLKRIVFS